MRCRRDYCVHYFYDITNSFQLNLCKRLNYKNEKSTACLDCSGDEEIGSVGWRLELM